MFLVGQKQAEVFHGRVPHLGRRGVRDAVLLDADIDQIGRKLRQGQVAAGLEDQQHENEHDRLPRPFQVAEYVQHLKVSFRWFVELCQDAGQAVQDAAELCGVLGSECL